MSKQFFYNLFYYTALTVCCLLPVFLWWHYIYQRAAEVGVTIYIDLPEMISQGQAMVLNIEPCPPIKPGKGNVITGTFHHEAANTIDLYVEGLSKPIGTTDNHPFWSVTQQEFVEAGKLLPNEELQLYNGQTAKVVQILPRPGPERVHNLEVLNEHVYRVAGEGVLVHNQCAMKADWMSLDWGKNRLVKELHDHGFILAGDTKSGNGVMYINSNGDRIRIMPRPDVPPSRSSPSAKYEGEYYYRYCEKNGEWGPHVPIPDK
jgi:hypothetical protein